MCRLGSRRGGDVWALRGESQGLKPSVYTVLFGTTEVVP